MNRIEDLLALMQKKEEEKHKNAYPLFCSLEFYCFFSSSLIDPM